MRRVVVLTWWRQVRSDSEETWRDDTSNTSLTPRHCALTDARVTWYEQVMQWRQNTPEMNLPPNQTSSLSLSLYRLTNMGGSMHETSLWCTTFHQSIPATAMTCPTVPSVRSSNHCRSYRLDVSRQALVIIIFQTQT